MAARTVLKTALISAACAALLAGCNSGTGAWLNSWHGGADGSLANPPPQAKIMQTADSTWMEPVPKVTAVEKMVPAPTDADKKAIDRVATLERQVAQMQNDMNTMMPVLSRLVSVQTDIQAMLARLQTAAPSGAPATGAPMAGSAPAMPMAATSPAAMAAPMPLTEPMAGDTPGEPLPSAPPPPGPMTVPMSASATSPSVMSPPPAMSPAATIPPPPAAPIPSPPPMVADAAPVASHGTLKDVRLGEHPGKTRIVLDMSDKVAYSDSIDNDRQTLTIDARGVSWKGASDEQQITGSQLLSSWQALPDGQGGTRIVMKLLKPAKVLLDQALPSGGAGQDSRIVIDLAGS